MAKVKVAKKVKKAKKKHLKAKIVTSIITLFVIMVALLGIGTYLYGEYKNTFYPENVVESMEMSALARQMTQGRYMRLYDIAMTMAENGNGVLLTPIGKREFDYDSDMMVRMSTSSGSGRIIVAQGSGNIVDDIKTHAKEYASFIGKVEPFYTEKVSESGLLSGYQAAYSCGYITCGNVLSEQSFYLVALEFATNDIDRLFVVYATQDYRELGSNLKVIEDFALLALTGSEVPNEETDDSVNTDEDVEEVMSVEEINEYISHTYPVQTMNNEEKQVSATLDSETDTVTNGGTETGAEVEMETDIEADVEADAEIDEETDVETEMETDEEAEIDLEYAD